MRDPRKRKLSAGTTVMLLITLLITAGTVFVWTRLSSGKTVDLSRLRPESLNLQENTGSPEKIPDTTKKDAGGIDPTAAPLLSTPIPEKKEKSFTLTAAGTVALTGEVRKNSYYSDSKQYDYYDIMMLLKKELQSDLNIVFFENLLTDDNKATDVVSAAAGAAMLRSAGFDAAACGFSKAYDKKEEGIHQTRKLLKENGILPVGIYETAQDEPFRIMEANGVRVALIQYTETVASGTRKTMVKDGVSSLVPKADPETISADIARARAQGGEAVIILMNWGTAGKAPDKSMRTLAQQIADAGADLIIGSGSRIVSGAEMLTAAESGRQVPCIWSLGTALSGDRSNIRRISGILLHAAFDVKDGQAAIRELSYTPLYTWKFKQDSRYYYRCMPSGGNIPDGMDSEQQKMMKKAADTVRNAMQNSPVKEKTNE